MNDLSKTRIQETGSCPVTGFTVLELADIVVSLGLDPRATRVHPSGHGGVELVVTDERTDGLPVTLV